MNFRPLYVGQTGIGWGNALVRELGDNAELWSPNRAGRSRRSDQPCHSPPNQSARMYHRSTRHVSRISRLSSFLFHSYLAHDENSIEKRIYILLPSFLTLSHLLERVKLCTFLARDKSRATRNSDEYSSALSSRTIERLDWWEFQHARFPLPFSRRTIFTEMRPNWRRPPIIAPPLLLNLRMLNVVVTSAEFAEYPARVG